MDNTTTLPSLSSPKQQQQQQQQRDTVSTEIEKNTDGVDKVDDAVAAAAKAPDASTGSNNSINNQIAQLRTLFPTKLYNLLSDETCAHAISWAEHGRAWKVHDQEKLEEHLAKYFKHR